jgi:hypothetical protein
MCTSLLYLSPPFGLVKTATPREFAIDDFVENFESLWAKSFVVRFLILGHSCDVLKL